MPGGINNVDFRIFPLASRDRRCNCNAPLLFVDHPIHYGFAIMDLTDFMGTAGVIQDPLCYRRLAGINMRNNADISYISDFYICTHRINNMFAFTGTCKSIWPARVADSSPLIRIFTASTSGTFSTTEFTIE